MSTNQILLLGALAGFTIFLGLPIGRLRNPAVGLKAFLSAAATGILLFLFWDVLTAAAEPVESALTAAAAGEGTWSRVFALGLLFVAGLAVGLLGLVYWERLVSRRRAAAMMGPGAVSAVEMRHRQGLTPSRSLALFIAVGIGLHNFAEGLAIGQSAAAGEISLALLLIVGFGLHNATEGFGIVAPLAGDGAAELGLSGSPRPHRRRPHLLGTLVGQAWVNEFVSVAFLTLAAGSILYVVIELLNVNRGFGLKRLVTWGLLTGLLAGFLTDWILVAAGG